MCMESKPLRVNSMQHAVSKESPFVKSLGDKSCLTYLDSEGILRTISWCSFAEKVENLAAQVQSLPEHGRVAIIMKRSCSMIISQAACHLAGRTYVPIDPTWPLERISKLLECTSCVGMIVDDGSMLAKKFSIEAIGMDLIGNCTTHSGGTYARVDEPEIMYILFTSGSTGVPKGVEVYSEGIWNFLQFKSSSLNVTKEDVFIIKTPCTFDVSVGEMWLPLVTGTISHVLGDGYHLEADKVCQALEKGRVTICHFVPSVMMLFLSQLKSYGSVNLERLRMVQCSGEALKTEHRIQLSNTIRPNIELVNLYGPTEASIEVAYMFCEEKDDQYLSHGFPIGYTPKGVDIFITDVEDPTRRLEDGEVGEICIAGVQVAKGYLGQPELSNERFLKCPWKTSGRKMMYRTGDLGRVNPKTGWLEYNGRFDRQVKIGGVRIELGEIESVVMKLFGDALETAAVLFTKSQQQLIGVLVPKKNCSVTLPTMKDISDGILRELPKAYNPHEWHTIDKEEIPLTTSGKIDYNALEKRVTSDVSVQMWAEVYDQLYDDNQTTMEDGADPTMDWASYKDSFNPTSLHRRDVIAEWVGETVKMSLAQAKESAGSESAATVCEMGCGKGMIILKIAPHVKAAVSGDISKFAVKHVRNVWDGYMKENNMHGHNKGMHVVACDAVAFDKLPQSIRKYNVVVCNGVSMYFPSFTYLMSYFDGAFDHISDRDGGAVILGDVRSLHHSALFQLRRLMQVGRSAQEAREQAIDFSRDDKDRTYDYRAFYALHELGYTPSKVEAVEVQLKMGELASEFTGYRFDVTFHVGNDNDMGEDKKTSDGEYSESYPIEVVGKGIKNLDDIVSKLKNAVTNSQLNPDETVFSILDIPNERLWSDHLVASSQDDNIGFATEGVGIKPSKLRDALKNLFSNDKHIVLTWSRHIGSNTPLSDSHLAAMDVHVVPAHDRNAKMSGLRAIAKFALAPHDELCNKLNSRNDFEQCISEIQSSIATTSNSDSAVNVQTAITDAKTALSKGDSTTAVQILVACSLGHTRQALLDLMNESEPNITFEELGGNSFMAMKLILQLRTTLGAAPAVFKILTESLALFLEDAARTIDRQRESSVGEWVVEGQVAGSEGIVSEDAPSIVLFPTAGGSPKVYAKTYSHLKTEISSRLRTGAKIFLAQPPGRDARANEDNLTDFGELVLQYSNALVKILDLNGDGVSKKVIMCGDSLGSITCWSVARRLCQLYPSFRPHHMVMSGNPSPKVAGEQYGLGTFAKQSIHDDTDQDLLDFLTKGHAGFGKDDDAKEVLDALRCDCIMYEDFKYDGKVVRPLPVPATLCRGSNDPFVTQEDVEGWETEFKLASRYVALEGAGHHIYSEAGPQMAQLLMDILC